MLPYQIRNPGVSEVERREDLEDGIKYQSSDQGRQSIEEKRIQLLGVGFGATAVKLRDDLQAGTEYRGSDLSACAVEGRHARLLFGRYAMHLSLGLRLLHAAEAPRHPGTRTGVGLTSPRRLRRMPPARIHKGPSAGPCCTRPLGPSRRPQRAHDPSALSSASVVWRG